MHTKSLARAVLSGILISALALPPAGAAEAQPTSGKAKKDARSPQQKTYATPEAAVRDFVTALRAGDERALLSIFGAEAKPLVASGDKVADREGAERLLQSYEEANRLDKASDGKLFLVTGKDDWSFPIPLVEDGAGWRFDTRAGSEEILNRRIGRNELYTVQAMLAYVDAQREYYLNNPQQGKLLQYAQRFGSSPGKRDGLYYPTRDDEPPSPLGPLFESARARGYEKGKGGEPAAYHGYRYRILKAQGPHAPGGAYDYVANGRMIGGFALVAWPATYGNSGVMTFIVNHDGTVYQKDLGPDTPSEVQKIMKFDPDASWTKVGGA